MIRSNASKRGSPIAKLVEDREYFRLDGNLENVQQQETLHD